MFVHANLTKLLHVYLCGPLCDPKFMFALANDNHTRCRARCFSFTSCSCTSIEVELSQCIRRDTEHRSLPNHRPSNKASTHRLQFVHGKRVHAVIAQGVAFVRVVTAHGDVEVPARADLHLLHFILGKLSPSTTDRDSVHRGNGRPLIVHQNLMA